MATSAEAVICNVSLLRIGQRDFITDLDPGVDDSENAEVCAIAYPTVLKRLLAEFAWSFASTAAVLVPNASNSQPGWDQCFVDPSDLIEPQYIFTGYRPAAAMMPVDCDPWMAPTLRGEWPEAPFEHIRGHIFTDWFDPATIYGSTVTYLKNQVVSDGGSNFRSLQDNNTGHPTSDGTWWTATTDTGSVTLVYTGNVTDTTTFPPLFIDYLQWELAQELSLSIATRADLAEKFESKIEQSRAKAFAAEANGRQQDPPPVSRYIAARR